MKRRRVRSCMLVYSVTHVERIRGALINSLRETTRAPCKLFNRGRACYIKCLLVASSAPFPRTPIPSIHNRVFIREAYPIAARFAYRDVGEGREQAVLAHPAPTAFVHPCTADAEDSFRASLTR